MLNTANLNSDTIVVGVLTATTFAGDLTLNTGDLPSYLVESTQLLLLKILIGVVVISTLIQVVLKLVGLSGKW